MAKFGFHLIDLDTIAKKTYYSDKSFLVWTHMSKITFNSHRTKIQLPDPINTDKALFLYLPEAHAISLLNRGEIKIGTLTEYWKKEKYDEQYGTLDVREGYKRTNQYIDQKTFSKSDIENHHLLNGLFVNVGEKSSVTLNGITIEEHKKSTDYFVKSFSSKFSSNMYDQIQGADTCIKITSPNKMFLYLSKELKNIGISHGSLRKCIYNDRTVEYDGTNGPHEVFCKDKCFGNQYEYRAAWQIPEGWIMPENQINIEGCPILTCRRLTRIVVLHHRKK